MHVPAPPAPPVFTMAAVGIAATELSPTASPFGAAPPTRLSLRSATLNVLAGHPAVVSGTLTRAFGARAADVRSAALSGRFVVLQAAGRHGWRTIARVSTRANGSFRLRFLARGHGGERVRLRFAGDAGGRSSSRTLGRLNVRYVSAAASAKAMCVAALESSLRWQIVDPPYSGGLQFSEGTWLAAGGGRFSSTAAEATPEQQMQVFSEYEPSHPGAWPVTVPACS